MKLSFASDDSSTLESIILLLPMEGRMTRVNITTPIPPTQHVAMRQKWSPRGRASTLSRIEAPVVVNPDTLSNQAFMGENSPPHIK